MISVAVLILSLLDTPSATLTNTPTGHEFLRDFSTGRSVTLAEALTPAGKRSFEAFVCRDLRSGSLRKEGLAPAKCPALSILKVKADKNCTGTFSGISVEYHYNAEATKLNPNADYFMAITVMQDRLKLWVYSRFKANFANPLCPPPYLLPALNSK